LYVCIAIGDNKTVANPNHKKMKTLITLLAAIIFTTASFATTSPAKFVVNTVENKLQVSLNAGGKVSITWTAVTETATTAYKIEKSVNGAEFKTVAILMGETLANYSFKDKVTGTTGNITYRVVTTDNNTVVNTATQTLVVL
jgi:hypothetical protein